MTKRLLEQSGSGVLWEYVPDERIEVGPASIEHVPLCDVREVSQYRQEYDPGGIEDLAYSIINDREMLKMGAELDDYQAITQALDLGTPLIINRMDRVHLDAFLEAHAEHYQADVEDIFFDENQEAVEVLASGHRRRRALLWIADEFGFDASKIYAQAAVYDNLSFEETLAKQYRENVTERPPRTDEAAAIARLYRQWCAAGVDCSPGTIADFFGVKRRVVVEALSFDSLPSEVQEYARQDILPYGLIVRFGALAKTLHVLHGVKGNAEPQDEYVRNELLVVASKLSERRLRGAKVKQLHQVLSAQMAMTEDATKGAQDALFLIEEEPSDQRRRNATSAAIARAIRLLEMGRGELGPEHRVQLGRLASRTVSSTDDVPLF